MVNIQKGQKWGIYGYSKDFIMHFFYFVIFVPFSCVHNNNNYVLLIIYVIYSGWVKILCQS